MPSSRAIEIVDVGVDDDRIPRVAAGTTEGTGRTAQ